MNIVLSFDSSVTSQAPALATEIENVCNAVAKFYDAEFASPITVTLDIGWGEVNGQTISPGALAQSSANLAGGLTYAQLVNVLTTKDTSANLATAIATLPTTDPTNGGTFYMARAEAKALGVSTSTTGPDGWVGIDAGANWDFSILNNSAANAVPAGEYDLFGVVAHEISEDLGRNITTGTEIGAGNYMPLDLFDFTGNGARTVVNEPLRYFSLDNGATALLDYALVGDRADWSYISGYGDAVGYGDAFGFGIAGIPLPVSATDISLLNLLGYAPAAPTTPTDYTASHAVLAGTINFLINNIAAGPAPASATGVYLSSTPTVTTSGTLVGSFSTADIGADSSISGVVSLSLPSGLADGAYFLAVIANSNGAVSESNAANDTSNVIAIQVVDNANMASITATGGVNAVEAAASTTLTATVDCLANLNVLATVSGAQFLTIGSAGELSTGITGEVLATGQGIDLADSAAQVTNLGTINGVSLGAGQGALNGAYGGHIVNGVSGLISGYNAVRGAGLFMHNAGVVDGLGDAGAYGSFGAENVVYNLAGGLIEGAKYGVLAQGAFALENYGTVSGPVDAVKFTNASDLLVIEPGSVLLGAAVGGGAQLQLARGTGTVGGLGVATAFSGFASYIVEGGGYWSFTGANRIGAGQSLTNYGVLTNVGTFVDTGVLINAGSIASAAGATGSPGGQGGIGLHISAGGTASVVNYSGIQGGAGGTGGAGAAGTGGAGGAGGAGFYLYGAADLTNKDFILGGAGGTGGTGSPAGSAGAYGDGIDATGSVTIVNGAGGATGALIEGAAGIYVFGGAGSTVTNFGTIEGTSGYAVVFKGTGDRLVVESGSTLVGKAVGGGGSLELAGSGDTLTGLGTTFTGFSYYLVQAGAAWTISGANTVDGNFFDYGALTNTGSIAGATGAAGSPGGTGGGGIIGLIVSGSGSVTSSGRIQGGVGGTGGAGGAGTGGAGGPGGEGIALSGSAGAVNTGTILGGAGGAGGSGATIGASGYPGDGVDMFPTTGDAIVNGASTARGALIKGAAGVYVAAGGPATVTNFGTIDGTGGSAIIFQGSSDRLVVEAGSTWIGNILGGGGTLELAGGTGTITGLDGAGTLSGAESMTFSGFGTYQIDTGSSWTLAGANTVAANKTLTSHGSLTNNGSFTVVGTLIDQGSLANAAGKTLTIANGGTLEAQGVVASAGTIAVASTGSTTDLRILPAGVTLTGGGKIVLSGAKDRILGFSKTSTLTNVDNTIAGTCIFGAANLLTLVNESKGTIDATGVMTLDTSGSTVTNAGLMESTTGGLLTVSATTINQSGGGTLNAAGGMINLTGGSDIIGGVIASTTGWAVRALTGANMLDGTTSTVNLTGTLQVLSTDTLTIVGTINNTGKLNPYGGTLMIGAGGAVLTGAGQVNLTANAANAITSTAAGATLTNAGNAIFGSGTIGGGTLTLVNQAAGVISNGLSVALTINTGSNTVINAGAIAATAAGGGVMVQSAVNNTGRLIANAGGTLTMNGVVTGAGIGQINGGELIIAQAFAENVFFLGKGVLELEDSTAYTGKIVGLSNTGTNSLDLRDITFTSGVTKATYSGTTASGTLTVTDGTHTAHIQLVGNYTTAGAFVLSSDGHGGTSIVDPTPSTPALLTQAMASFEVGAAANPAGPSPGTSTNLPLIAVHG